MAEESSGEDLIQLTPVAGFGVTPEPCVVGDASRYPDTRENDDFGSDRFDRSTAHAARGTPCRAVPSAGVTVLPDGERKRYVCGQCCAVFQFQGALSAHAACHSNERPFKCDRCGSTFRRRGNLSIHVQKHDKPAPYTCGDCGAVFSLYSKFRKHSASHLSDRVRSTCQMCGRAFRRTGEAGSSGVVTVDDCLAVCNRCARSRKRSAGPAVKRSHMCEVCAASFRCKSHLQTHRLLHTGEKPFHCDDCGRRFRQKSHVKTHKLKHHPKRRFFSCTKCDLKFDRKWELNLHSLHAHTRCGRLPRRRRPADLEGRLAVAGRAQSRAECAGRRSGGASFCGTT